MSPKIELAVTCLAAPLVVEGTVAGVRVYYRARHYRWGMELRGPAGGVLGTVEELHGECSAEEELSLAHAMQRIFAPEAIREAVAEAEMAELDAQFAEAEEAAARAELGAAG